ncbi:unnamed protein product [Symbiodinium sp. CCMP2456]|nr:unnamed protein product [Symbiodinium sp. CCMP2456]
MRSTQPGMPFYVWRAIRSSRSWRSSARNSDRHVDEKMLRQNEKSVSYADRADLVRLASAEVPWMDFNPGREAHVIGRLQAVWPHLQFVRFLLNGADDVVKYQKWQLASPEKRYITIGRPGFTEKVEHGARRDGVALDQGFFILVPGGSEVSDVSSTLVRDLLRKGDRCRLAPAEWDLRCKGLQEPVSMVRLLGAVLLEPCFDVAALRFSAFRLQRTVRCDLEKLPAETPSVTLPNGWRFLLENHKHLYREWDCNQVQESSCSAMLHVIQDHGGSVEGLAVADVPGRGRGLLAATKLVPNRRLISVPSQCVLYERHVKDETVGMQRLVSYLHANETAQDMVSNKFLLSAFILEQLQHRSPSKRFAPYLRDLRKSAQTMLPRLPLFWPAGDQAELQGTMAEHELPRMRRAMRREYDVLSAAAPNLAASHPLAEYQAAYSFVAARSFTLPPEAGEDAVLYPFIDMANHEIGEPNATLNSEEFEEHLREAAAARVEVKHQADGFTAQLFSQHAFLARQEVTVAYGGLGNHWLLPHFVNC